LTAVAWNLGAPGETAFLADGWGQRDWKNSDLGATLPYIVRRTTGGGDHCFVTVFEAHGGSDAFVRDASLRADGVLVVRTALGTDYIRSALEAGELSVVADGREHRRSGRFAVASVQSGRLAWDFVE
jgi:hypothetical protein